MEHLIQIKLCVGKSVAAQERHIAQEKLLQAWTFFAPANKLSFEEYQQKFKLQVCI